jgi:hypothetical protein
LVDRSIAYGQANSNIVRVNMVKAGGRAYPPQAMQGPAKIHPSSSSTSTSEGQPMPKPAEIVAALGDVSAIDSYATLQAEMVDLFTSLANHMCESHDERSAQIMRKMAATIGTVPYDMLAELGHSYNPTLIAALILDDLQADAPDYADAHDFVLTLLDELRSIDLDHPDAQRAIEEIKAILKPTRRR